MCAFERSEKGMEFIMDTQENIYPKTDCVALAVRKEHRLMVINKVKKTTIRISLKTLFYAIFITVVNIFV